MTRTISVVRRLHRLMLDLVLPPCCVVCGKVETWLCDGCAERIPFADRPVCPRCGDAWDGPGLCVRCRTSPLRVAPIMSVFVFDGVIRDAIHALKYRGGAQVAGPLSRRMADAWSCWELSSDLLVPVPLFSDREVYRGYNQSVLLTRALSTRVEVPMDATILYRTRATASQTHLGRQERWENVRNAFACSETCDLSGLRIMLLDDVATTGATLDACAVALVAQGARAVSALTLAHAL